MIRLAESATRAVSARGRAASWRSTASATRLPIPASGVRRITCESGPCSACDSRSEATKSGLAPLSAITSTSDGPHGDVDGRAVQTLADLAFGLRDVSVTRAKDFIHLRHRLGTEGEGGDGLRAADVKDGFHAAQLRGVEDLIGDRRRRAEHHLLTAA